MEHWVVPIGIVLCAIPTVTLLCCIARDVLQCFERTPPDRPFLGYNGLMRSTKIEPMDSNDVINS
jgi:hypothetical protein